MNTDEQHLNLLGIFHFVFGGLALLATFIPLIYVGIGVAIATGALPDVGPDEQPLGFVLIALGLVGALMFVAAGVLQIMAGRRLRSHSGLTFCTVIAALECLSVPLGTALGVCTLVVLSRPSVKAMFGVRPPPVPAAR